MLKGLGLLNRHLNISITPSSNVGLPPIHTTFSLKLCSRSLIGDQRLASRFLYDSVLLYDSEFLCMSVRCFIGEILTSMSVCLFNSFKLCPGSLLGVCSELLYDPRVGLLGELYESVCMSFIGVLRFSSSRLDWLFSDETEKYKIYN